MVHEIVPNGDFIEHLLNADAVFVYRHWNQLQMSREILEWPANCNWNCRGRKVNR
jgi:hypothetical protein